MKKKYRLCKNEDFQLIINKKNNIVSSNLIIYYNQNLESANARIGISVGKKIGIAVIRNRIKRQLRQMVTAVFDLSQKKDYVIMVRKNYLLATYEENLEVLKKLYAKLHSIKE